MGRARRNRLPWTPDHAPSPSPASPLPRPPWRCWAHASSRAARGHDQDWCAVSADGWSRVGRGLSVKNAGVEVAEDIIYATRTPDLPNLPLAATAGLPNLGGRKVEVIFADHQGNTGDRAE